MPKGHSHQLVGVEPTYFGTSEQKQRFEYQDYRAEPCVKSASAFISMALDANLNEIDSESGYMQYIANRPCVEKHGTHGLFGAEPFVDLDKTILELEQDEGPVWTIIYSLRREDAARLSYDNANAWRNLLMLHESSLADAMRIPAKDFRWYAAFHDEGHHPHIHMMIWSDDPKKGFLTKDGIAAMRSKLTNTIFQDEMKDTFFLPFNQGSAGAGRDGGKGNPPNPDGYPTAYLWEQVFQKDSMMDILQKFIHLQVKEDKKLLADGSEKVTKKKFPLFSGTIQHPRLPIAIKCCIGSG